MGWSFHKVTIVDAVNAGIVERINAKTGKSMTHEEFLKSCRAKCLTKPIIWKNTWCSTAGYGGAAYPWDTIIACDQ